MPNISHRTYAKLTIFAALVATAGAASVYGRAARSLPSFGIAPKSGVGSRDSMLGPHDWESRVEIARSLLITSRPNQALKILMDAWNRGDHSGWSQGRVAFYLGLCHSLRGDTRLSREWFDVASSTDFPESTDQGEDIRDLFASLGLQCRQEERGYVRLVAADAEKAMPPAEQLKAAAKAIREAEKQVAGKELAPRIRLATWLLLFGELTAKEQEFTLCSNSLDAFDQGRKLLDEIVAEIDADPKLQDVLEKDPQLALRYDAAVVRRNITEERAAMARKEERDRLNQLRSLVTSYRDATTSMGLAELQFLLGSPAEVKQSHVDALKQLQTVQNVVAARRDYYLFSDEPRREDNADLQAVTTQPLPVSKELSSLIKSVIAMADYRQATQTETTDQQLLQDAQRWATAAIDEKATIDNVPPGFDEKNPLAHYVIAAVCDTIARNNALSDDPTVRTQSKDQLRLAGEHAQTAATRISSISKDEVQKGAAELSRQVSEIQSRLGGPDASRKIASELFTAGRLKEAQRELFDGVRRHKSDELAAFYLHLCQRMGESIDDLNKKAASFRAAGLLAEGTPPSALVQSRIACQEAGKWLMENGVPTSKSAEADAIAGRLEQQRQQLHKSAESTTEPLQKAILEAQLALSASYLNALASTSTRNDSLLQEVLKTARDASHILESSRDTAGGDAFAQLSRSDALIASRLAIGHLGAAVLPNYRDESSLAFSAALDEAAQHQGTAAGIELIGSPLLSAIRNRTGESDARLAAEERERRQMMTRFVESLYTLQFGEPKAAAEQLGEAVRQASTTSDRGGTLRAETLLRDADGFEAQISLPDTVRAFQILGEAKAGDNRTATSHAIDLIAADRGNGVDPFVWLLSADTAAIQRVADRIHSPLIGAAVALAAEQYAADLANTDQIAEQDKALELCRAAWKRSATLLTSPQVGKRFPHLVAMVTNGNQRHDSQDVFLTAARRDYAAGNVASALAQCRAGLGIHPKSQDLWALRIRLELDPNRMRRATDADLTRTQELLPKVAQRGFLTTFEQAYNNAVLQEQLEQYDQALAGFDKAATLATDGKQRVEALSKSASLRTRMAISPTRT